MRTSGFQGLRVEVFVSVHDLGVDHPSLLIDEDSQACNRWAVQLSELSDFDGFGGPDHFRYRVGLIRFERKVCLGRVWFLKP